MTGCSCRNPLMYLTDVQACEGVCQDCGEVVTVNHISLMAVHALLRDIALPDVMMYQTFAEVVRVQIPHLCCEIEGCWCLIRSEMREDPCACETCIACQKMLNALVSLNETAAKNRSRELG